ncbi:hypothetical protein [Streptomyces sp. 1-11]|uniref:hypothetical protein n=1 Tax=Streptomyces sp. 1-11 TaxID=2590549 RepID=UPI00116C4C04|nr:hypothetical protein [Streptomyces sp. 1-11]GEJ97820.1 hypothetical protein TNCT1_00970 [Streptomyces sp. 1-11]
MSASLSLVRPTWQVVLPWLDQLGPEQLLALQRLGGPAQWWMHETPEETSARRPYMDDVFDLLASFLGWAIEPELDIRPLHLLLPSLPQQMSTAELELEPTALDVLQAVGGRTLADVARLTPSSFACLAKVRTETKRDILAVLVRAAALFPQPESSLDETANVPSSSPVHTEPDSPDHAVQGWFISLDARQQDLITQHVCASDPMPLDELAARYRTMRSWMTRLLEELPQQLQSAALTSPNLARALQLFESATQTPVTRSDLMDCHPWLAERLPGSELRVLELLLAFHWSGSTDGDWLFSGSLAHARKLTRSALDLAPGEAVSLPSAMRLLKDTGRPLKATEQWLHYCGLHIVGGRQVELAVDQRPRGDATMDGDYELTPPRPVAHPDASGAATVAPSSTSLTRADLDPGRVPESAPRLEEVFERLRVYACAQHPGEQLADLLRNSEELPEPLRTLVVRALGAIATPDGWQVPDDAPGSETHGDDADLSGEESAASGTARRARLADRALAVLEELGHPLDWPLLVDRIGPDVNARSLKTQLSKDDRFVRSDVNSWALAQWGLRPYTSIKELIAQEVDRAGGSIPTDELVTLLTREFTIAAASVRVSASSPPFTARNGVVRRLSDVGSEQGSEQSSTDVTRPDDGPSADDLINLMGL